MIEKEDEYDIVVDGVAIATTDTFMCGFCNYLASFYCLNLAYPASLKKTLQFFQRVIMNIQDTSAIDKSVVRVVDKINKARI